MSGPKGDADRSVPPWARPLAPLPEWTRTVEALLREHRSRAPCGDADHAPERLGCTGPWRGPWLEAWRESLGITPDEAAEILGSAEDGADRVARGGDDAEEDPDHELDHSGFPAGFPLV